MKTWIVILSVGMAGIAALTLPVRATHQGEVIMLPEVRAYEKLLQAQRVTSEVLAQTRTANRFVPEVVASTDPVWVGGDVDDDLLLLAREHAAGLTVGWEIEEPRAAVGLALQPWSTGEERVPRVDIGDAYFFGEQGGQPYCLSAQRSLPASIAQEYRQQEVFRAAGTLEACSFFARYGLPGPAVQEWLARGGMGFARFDSPPGNNVLWAPSGALEGRGSFGMALRGRNVEVLMCSAGVQGACASIVEEPRDGIRYAGIPGSAERVVAESPVSAAIRGAPTGPGGPFLLARLADEYGGERFQRFWSWQGPDLAEAFEAGFEVPLDAWVHERMTEESGLDRTDNSQEGQTTIGRAGPSPVSADFLYLAVVMALGGAVAAAFERRRTV